jgi:hypothetical protein
LSAARKLVAFAFVLLAVFAAGYGLGVVIDPGGAPAPMDHMNMNMR